MARFLNRDKAVAELVDMIGSSEEKLTLISPYLKLSADFRERIRQRDSQNLRTTIVFGKKMLDPEEEAFFSKLHLVSLKFYEDLHAKCYFTDNRMIITSLNILEFSMAKNKEMGVLINRKDPLDMQLFDEAMKEVALIMENSQPCGIGAVLPLPASDKSTPRGYCIRTGIPIPFNPSRPLSYEAYLQWEEYGNIDYPEKFCHFSGEPSQGENSFRYPVLRKNWKLARQQFPGL